MTIEIIIPDQKEAIAKDILFQLPEWFGVPESTMSYITGVKDKPFWAAYVDDTPIGFIALKETSPATAEIYVMGVLPERHRSGAGRALYEAFEYYAQEKGYSFIQVKTVRKGYWASKSSNASLIIGIKAIRAGFILRQSNIGVEIQTDISN